MATGNSDDSIPMQQNNKDEELEHDKRPLLGGDQSGLPPPPPYAEANTQQYPPAQQAQNPAYPPQQYAPPPQQQQQQYPPQYTPQQGAYPPQQGAYPPQNPQPQPYGEKQVPPPYSQPGYTHPQQPGYTHQHAGAMSQQNTTSTTTVIMSQPANFYAPQTIHLGEAPPSYMWLSWLVCLFCCWPLGLAAIIASSRVDSAISSGNLAEARAQSSRAKSYAIAGFISGMIIIALLIVRFTVMVQTYNN